MTSKQNLEHLAGALSHAWNHFSPHQEGPPPTLHGFTVALSREVGVPGSTIAHEVGRRLAWPVFDHELLERIAEEMHLRPNLLSEVDERPVSWLVERLETFLITPKVSEPAYVEHLIGTLLALSAHGRCVVVGRGSVFLLPEAQTLRVRLLAPLKDRIDAVAHEEGLTVDRAAQRVATIDHDRAAFAHKHFRTDPTDPTHYDLSLNCSRFGVAECADLIIEALHRLEAMSEPGPRQAGSRRFAEALPAGASVKGR